MSDSLQPLWTVPTKLLSMRFSRHECWRGLPFPPLGELPDPGIEAASPELAGEFFTTEPHGKPLDTCTHTHTAMTTWRPSEKVPTWKPRREVSGRTQTCWHLSLGCLFSKIVRKYVVVVGSLSRVWLFASPWTLVGQAPLSMGFPSKNTGMGCHFLLQGIFPPQGSNLDLLHCRQTLYHLSYQGSPRKYIYVV